MGESRQETNLSEHLLEIMEAQDGANFHEMFEAADMREVEEQGPGANNPAFPPINIVARKKIVPTQSQQSNLVKALRDNMPAAFYRLLENIYKENNENPDDFFAYLKDVARKNKGQTPFHRAAANGYDGFFVKPDELSEEVWRLIKSAWLNAKDAQGNAPLHLAMSYSLSPSQKQIEEIRNKKQVVLALTQMEELDLVIPNDADQIPLIVAANKGYYETAKVLLKVHKKTSSKDVSNNKKETKLISSDVQEKETRKEEITENLGIETEASLITETKEPNLEKTKKIHLQWKDSSGRTAFEIASNKGHQRIEKEIEFYQAQKPTKLKNDASFYSYTSVEDSARNINVSEEDFMKKLKSATQLTYDEVIKLIDLRVEAGSKSYLRKTVLSVVFGEICPAITLAVFFGTFGGV